MNQLQETQININSTDTVSETVRSPDSKRTNQKKSVLSAIYHFFDISTEAENI